MTLVGIIANPVSGKDIRRLVAHGSVFDNQEKVRIVRRLLTGLESAGVDKVVFMPDDYAIVRRAVGGVSLSMDISPLDMKIRNNQTDSTRAGALMEQAGAGALIVLGGDGTCRAVSKGTRLVPMLPLSTGTNNVFPYMMEATVAGLAAGFVASGRIALEKGVFRSCCLEVVEDGEVLDTALVDVAVYNDRFIASRAVWDMTKVSQIFLTRSRPDSIGLSAVGGQLAFISPQEPKGLSLGLGPSGGCRVTAAIGPGLLTTVSVTSQTFMKPDDALAVKTAPCVLALDGEREVVVKQKDRIMVRLSDKGPFVIDPARTMARVQQSGLMKESS